MRPGNRGLISAGMAWESPELRCRSRSPTRSTTGYPRDSTYAAARSCACDSRTAAASASWSGSISPPRPGSAGPRTRARSAAVEQGSFAPRCRCRGRRCPLARPCLARAEPGAARGSAGDPRRARNLRRLHAARGHRQRQDRGLPRGCPGCGGARRPGADPDAGDQPDAPVRVACASRIARDTGGDAAQRPRRGDPPRELGGRGERRSADRARNAACRVRPDAGACAGRRRRGARRFFQAAGRGPLPRARPRDPARPQARHTGGPGERHAVARDLGARTAGPLPRAGASRARRSARVAARNRVRPVAGIANAGRPLAAIAQRLARREQALLFINRRGYAPSLKCASCAWESECPRCAARLVVHHAPDRLRCHHCAHVERVTRACPQCGNVDLTPLGFGTQRLEQAMRTAFPQARVARIDRDTTRNRGAFAAVRQQVEDLEVDILVGTQMLAKGHDFPRLTLVGVLGADNALYSADFRATERLVALLMQVAGRAGRAGLPGQVIVQTDFPDHAVCRALATQDYAEFADAVLAEREAAQLPPVTRVALLAAEAHSRDDVDRFLAAAVERAHALADGTGGIEIFPPVPAAMARRAGYERGQVLVQCLRRAPLQAFLPRWREALVGIGGSKLRWTIDVDPVAF